MNQPQSFAFRGFRYPHLNALWERLCREGDLPQLDRWLAGQLREQRQFGKKDRIFYADALFTAMRYLNTCVALESGYQSGPDSRSGQAVPESPEDLWQVARTLPGSVLWFWVKRVSELEGDDPLELTDADQRNEHFRTVWSEWSRTTEGRLLQLGLQPGWQDWFQRRKSFMQWSDDELAEFQRGQNTRPPLWLRVQKPAQVKAVTGELEQAGFSVEADEDALQVSGPQSIYRTAAYKLGGVEIQDWASQQVSRAVDAEPGMRVWDACAGAGGKTLGLASRMNNQGELLATDVRAHALEELRLRARRAGWFALRTEVRDACEPLPQSLIGDGFDRVLVDAPCTGTGTWRRSPDRRWFLTDGRVRAYRERQLALLDGVAPAVRTGGCLIYATCSWLVEENEQLVMDWLAHQSGFRLEKQALVGFPRKDSDTLYYAVMTRFS